MKKLLSFISLGMLPLFLLGQDCASMYDYFKTGVLLEYTSFDKKGKVQSVTTHAVQAVEEHADTLVANVHLTSTNEKGKDLYQSDFPIKCHDGVIYVDMRSVIPQQPNQNASGDMQIEVEGTDLLYPKDMRPGQELPDSEMEMRLRMGSLQIMNTRYQVKNRKVEARETVATMAGAFDCLKISYDLEYKLMGTRSLHTELWYATSVGMVKTISYDRKGNEESRMELTKLVK